MLFQPLGSFKNLTVLELEFYMINLWEVILQSNPEIWYSKILHQGDAQQLINL